MSNSDRKTRRSFLTSAAGAVVGPFAAPLVVSSRALGRGSTPPSDRVTVGIIGSGGRGVFETRQYIPFDNCEIVAVCDVQESRRVAARETLEKLYSEQRPSGTYRGIRMYNDFRELLRQKDIDAVYIATPDHWHVPITVAALKAGKDCHTEKPLGVSIEQDLAALKAVRKYRRVFQYGAERRSTPDARHAIELVLNGRIGKVQKIYVVSPGSETGGSATPVLPVPKGFDYDLWLGPAPFAPFCYDRCLNEAHNGIYYIYDYALGLIANWAAHPLDQVQWWADNSGFGIPVRYEGTGKIPTEGLFNTARVWDLRCTYENGLVMHFLDNQTFRDYPDAPHPDVGRRGIDYVQNAAIFVGTEGWIAVTYEMVVANPASLLTSEIAPGEIHLQKSSLDSRPPGLPEGHQQFATAGHHQNWIQCIKTRKDPVDPIESALRSDLISQLSDICIRAGCTVRWDPVRETIIGDAAAQKMMSRPMRGPWKLS